MKGKILVILWLLFGLILSVPCFSQNAGWQEGWKYRLTVEVPALEDKYPVEKTAVLDFFGKAKDDGSDIRIFDVAGKELPLLVIPAGGENRYQVAFPADKGTYFLYCGNPEANLPEHDWKPQRGLVLEVYERSGDNVSDWNSVKSIIDKSRKGKLIGRSFWEKVWDGTNPFGAEKNTVRIYEGCFYVFAPGPFTFATSSAGPSYLLIDGQTVTSWEGWHNAEPFVRPERAGNVSLDRGLHRFTYYHIGRPGQEISVAAIKQGNTDKFDVIPENFFLPVAKPSITGTESFDRPVTAVFGWENTNYLKREDWELLTFRFRDASFSETEITEWQWRFGDGHEGSGKEVHHTYLKGGVHPVSLKIKDKKGNTAEITMKVFVQQDYSKTRMDPLNYRQYLEEFKTFNINRLKEDVLLILAGIYESYGLTEDAYKVYKILNERPLDENSRYRIALISASLAEKRGDYTYAEQVYQKLISEKPAADVFLKLGALYLETKAIEKAEAQYLKVLDTAVFNDKSKRKASIGIGDIWRIKGDYRKALEIYEKASVAENMPVKAGSFAQMITFYIKEKDFSSALEKLMLWAEEMPVVKLHGNWSVLLARTYMLQKEYKKAIGEIDIFMGICPDADNLYLPWALYLKGESYEESGEKEKAKNLYLNVTEKYPSSGVSRMALKKLEGFQ